jgi:hypothetical protein
MRVLNIVCGLSVLLVTLHLAHAIHHFYVHRLQFDVSGVSLWSGIIIAALIGVFSFVGGCLLLRRA